MYAATRADLQPTSSESGRLSLTELGAGPSTDPPSYPSDCCFVRITGNRLLHTQVVVSSSPW
jgi:hypothetical protein